MIITMIIVIKKDDDDDDDDDDYRNLSPHLRSVPHFSAISHKCRAGQLYCATYSSGMTSLKIVYLTSLNYVYDVIVLCR